MMGILPNIIDQYKSIVCCYSRDRISITCNIEIFLLTIKIFRKIIKYKVLIILQSVERSSTKWWFNGQRSNSSWSIWCICEMYCSILDLIITTNYRYCCSNSVCSSYTTHYTPKHIYSICRPNTHCFNFN